MDFKQVFYGLLIVFVTVTSITLFATQLNNDYGALGAKTIDTGFMETSGVSEISGYAGGVSVDVANSTSPPSVSGSGELTQSKNTFSLIRSFVDFIPKLFRTTGSVLGIPKVYINAAVWAFIFGFGITLAYLLILGVKRLI